MSRASIRQPLVVYAVVFALVVILAMLALSGVALSRATRRAYGRAVRQELALFSRAGLLPGRPHPDAEVALGLVTTGSSALELDIHAVRARARGAVEDPYTVVLPLDQPGEEMYLVARFSPSIPTSIALVELSRIMPPLLLTALAAAGLMSVLVYRQLLPSLRTLADLAGEPRATGEVLPAPDAPNEIVEIALRFKETTRMLRSARERAEAQRDELERMQSSLLRASKLASVGRLAAGIAHEIGNPLAAVKGYLSLLQAGLPEAERVDVLERSLREIERIHTTILKLLTYARTGTEVRSEPCRFSLRSPLTEALALTRGHAALREVSVLDEVPDDGLEVVGHPGQLAQVLVNLLLNAGQAVASCPSREVRLVRSVRDTHATIEVTDSGPGVPLEHAESIFDPFFTTKAPGEGTGLGLALSRAMMESMGGALELVTDRPGGATFAVRIPLSQGSSALEGGGPSGAT